LFYVRDALGIATSAPGWLGFDRYGLAVVDERIFAFDDARNWHLVRTLVTDEEARVKWLFCSNEIKARLLRYAAGHEPSPEAIARATWVLHEPSRGDPHTDHFHLRVGCGLSESALGCHDEPPHWPWQGDPARKRETGAGVAASDPRLVRWLLAEELPDQSRHVLGGSVGFAPQPTAVAGRHLD
jgi:penicillin-insensitive murein endopeptidase